MSDANQIEILSAGVENWNAWRKHNPHLQPDLSRANLHGIVGVPPGKRRENPCGRDFGRHSTV
jgi:hypothetical protein